MGMTVSPFPIKFFPPPKAECCAVPLFGCYLPFEKPQPQEVIREMPKLRSSLEDIYKTEEEKAKVIKKNLKEPNWNNGFEVIDV